MSDQTQQPIIIKRVKKVSGGGHGGAWKIAYADFVTAMMAFFLLMWLLGSTAEDDLRGIAEGFDEPPKLAAIGGASLGEKEISSIIPGGGQDLSKSVGNVNRGTTPGKQKPKNDELGIRTQGGISSDGIKGDMSTGTGGGPGEGDRRAERGQLLDLKGRIEAIVEASPELRPFKNQILMDVTSEGLRIQIVDEQNRPMFNSASADVLPHMRTLLQAIGRALNDVPNKLSISGHTDSTVFAGGQRGFSNWELSSNRANASRRELVAGGLEPSKVLRVVGLADTVPFDPQDPAAPSNRRISLLVLNKQAEEAMRNEAMGGVMAPPSPDSDAQMQALEMRARGMSGISGGI